MTRPEMNEAFVRLFAQHERRIYSYILSLTGEWSAAEEVFQETCVVIWQKFDDFEAGTDFASWACRIACLKVYKYREQQSRRLPLLTDRFLETISEAALSRHDEPNERLAALAQCVDKLSASDRELIARRYAGDVTSKDVAQDLGRPANTVYKALQRIRKDLLRCVRRTLTSEAR